MLLLPKINHQKNQNRKMFIILQPKQKSNLNFTDLQQLGQKAKASKNFHENRREESKFLSLIAF